MPPARAAANTHAAELRVLVVDDDVLVAMGTVAMLEDLGHQPVEVHSGAAALEALASGGPFDLVITDHAMPSMSGLELAERIQEKYSTLPIILASGYVDIPEAGKQLVNLLRLNKPFSQEQLQQALSHTRGAIASVA